jgi:hypothetical protein
MSKGEMWIPQVETRFDEPMAPQDSTTICKKNSKGANVSIPIELQKK